MIIEAYDDIRISFQLDMSGRLGGNGRSLNGNDLGGNLIRE